VIRHLKESADKLASLHRVCADGNRLNLRQAVEGPLVVTAPADGATVHVGRPTPVRWSNAYKSARLAEVRIDFSPDDGASWPLTLAPSTANDGHWSWTSTAAQRTPHARIRLTPVDGNFPALSQPFKVV
jgi:hypothetical protein